MRGYCPLARRAVTTLAAACGVLVVLVTWQWVRGPLPVPAPPPAVPSGTAGSALAKLPRIEDLEPLEHFAEMVERPLFDESRRPAPAPPPAEEERVAQREPVRVQEPPPALHLDGVVIVGGDRVAMVRGPGPHPARRLEAGGEVEGWVVSDVRPRAIVLRQGEREAVFDLPVPAASAGVSVIR